MDPSTGQHQEIPTHSMENMLVCSKAQDKKPRPQPDQALKCPRCDSTNTKFCYYNNYSLSQPRYFCKSCRRYWTKGGTLRNVPVGGGCRKNKRSTNSKRVQDNQILTPNTNINPLTTHPQVSFDSNDLTLAFARLQKQCSGQLGVDDHDLGMLGNPNMSHCDVISNSSNIATPAFISSGFLEAQNNNFQNLYYGYGNGHMGCSGEMVMMPYENTSCGATTQAVTVTTMKQEMCNGNNNKDHENNKILWGFPWQQFNGNGSIMGGGSGDFDAGKESWINGLGGTNWHGLLNSALM